MNLQKQQRLIIDALEDTKAQDIKVFNTMGLTSLFDRVIIASGTSNRQTRAMASHVAERAKQEGLSVLAFEGEDTGEWVLVDLGDVVVHIMLPRVREFYALERLWTVGDQPPSRFDA
ncbi:MAG TPA: ribosome silencing factor, partial [Castellaniella sp.]|nr:ribosome silencing factor [Castellaniella sp.]